MVLVHNFKIGPRNNFLFHCEVWKKSFTVRKNFLAPKKENEANKVLSLALMKSSERGQTKKRENSPIAGHRNDILKLLWTLHRTDC